MHAWIGLIGIFLSLGLLMYLAYRGFTVLVLAPLLALMAVMSAGNQPLLATYTQIFMGAAGKYIIAYFPLFLLGAIFGKLMADSGSAEVIAGWIVRKTGSGRSILACVLACAILTYGGVSLFVVAFAVFPIAVALFREADVPKRLIPGTIALGSFTFTMTAAPGTPAIQNLIPMRYFGTDAFAAPGLGVIASIIMFGGGMAWLTFREKRAKRSGEGYDSRSEQDALVSPSGHSDNLPALQDRGDLKVLVAFLPIVLVIGLNFCFSHYVIPRLNTSYLQAPLYGSTTLDSVKGSWAIIAALVFACLAVIVLRWRHFADVKQTVNEGTMGALLPMFNTASEVGYGGVIASLAAFLILRDFVLGIAPGNPLISLSVAVNVLAGITGSASGGMSIALETLGKTYVVRGAQMGISPALMHRVTSIASGGFDTLPHNGAVISLLTICGLTHVESYADIFVIAVVIPIIALVAVIIVGSVYGSF